jgi:hypothetical protein
LELLATSFIADTLQAAQGLPSDPEKFDTAIQARVSKKRGSSDAFGSSADIAFKRQRLAQQIEKSKRILERFKAANTKEERKQIYALWEESNRFVSSNRVDYALTLLRNPFFPLFLGLWSYFRNPQLHPFSGHAMRKDALLSTATMKRNRWTRLDPQSESLRSSPLPLVELIFCRTCWLRDVCTVIVVSLHFYCVSTALLATCFSSVSSFPAIIYFPFSVIMPFLRLICPVTIQAPRWFFHQPAACFDVFESDHSLGPITEGGIFVDPRSLWMG